MRRPRSSARSSRFPPLHDSARARPRNPQAVPRPLQDGPVPETPEANARCAPLGAGVHESPSSGAPFENRLPALFRGRFSSSTMVVVASVLAPRWA